MEVGIAETLSVYEQRLESRVIAYLQIHRRFIRGTQIHHIHQQIIILQLQLIIDGLRVPLHLHPRILHPHSLPHLLPLPIILCPPAMFPTLRPHSIIRSHAVVVEGGSHTVRTTTYDRPLVHQPVLLVEELALPVWFHVSDLALPAIAILAQVDHALREIASGLRGNELLAHALRHDHRPQEAKRTALVDEGVTVGKSARHADGEEIRLVAIERCKEPE